MKTWKMIFVAIIAILGLVGFVGCGGDDTPNTYTVTFNSNGGSTVSSITGLSSGDTITEPTPPTKTGTIVNVFKGWYDQGLENAFDFDTPITGNITLYAKWDFQYALGDTGPGGGKIFYRSETGFTMTDDNSTAYYLEAAPDDMPTTLRWVAESYGGDETTFPDITGTETAIGTGRINTVLILATDADAPAAKACNEYSNGGKTDWFLPSKDELNELSKASYDNYWYWSSSQYNSSDAWFQYFFNNTQANYFKKSLQPVRAIRAF